MNRTYGRSQQSRNIVEKKENQFDEELFFRHLEIVATDVRQCLKQDKQRPNYKTKLLTAIKEMVSVVREGKIQARNLPKMAYEAFLGRISVIVKKTGVIVPDDIIVNPYGEDQVAIATGVKDPTYQTSIPDQPGENAASAEKWQVINLAVKLKQAGNVTVGVSKQGTNYYVFRRKSDGTHNVVPTTNLATAQATFYNLVKQSGYREISPGSYAAVRTGSV